ncbi:flavin monoamine oxidase family protein [Mycobacterium kubicae]|uniref:Flavin monoamine oxidase family protein n=2 Tax=Mycobacterium kubicae TaxID=120959 RepID=A0AAX1JD53_9MYCO|nr:flavin monoamine oxidase family protein [Mycobacterium kubicae]MCV7095688.1 flavin monoamine oxidase family protein [Mycobacterium kubicae]ORV94994.1 monooxygenase [Mycobacterium kubicae]QNI11071.1 flavin monoamine oxidase family protein [Mycobacterium kubicae]QPI39283.1 flavin monoamine oxidase family protein [Mycobacterium kubicae]
MTNPPWIVDVVVVGAGFAGLAAARELTRQGHDVLVFEGRDRVGGRSYTGSVAGSPADMGGSFVGPTQDAVLELAAELRIPTIPTHHDGNNLIYWRGSARPYSGTIPRLSLLGLLDMGRLRWQFERISRAVPVADPWNARRAGQLDDVSLGQWLRLVRASASSRDLMAIMSRVTWGCEPDDVSLLHAARYVHAAGGLDRLLDTENGAQQDRFPGGTQQIAELAAAELGDRVVLDAPVRCIERHGAGVTVTSSQGHAEAGFVIVAIPPAHRTAIEFNPPLPPEYQELARNWPQGSLSKAYAAYDKPFWRAKGFSGQALLDRGPVFITFDVSPDADGPGILLGFVDARAFDSLSADQRRRETLRCFASVFGDEALDPLDYADHRWGTETFAPGGPTAAVPPGSWTRFGRYLREPVGPIHWAGTETADEWTGFFDGAVRSGQRAAAEVSAKL